MKRITIFTILCIPFCSRANEIDEPPEPNETIEKQIEALGTNSGYRGIIAAQLGRMGRPALPALTRAVTDENPRTRSAAALALGEMGPIAKSAVPNLIRGFRQSLAAEKDSDRWAFPHAIGEIGPDAKSAIPVLVDATKVEDCCGPAIVALRKIGPEALQPLLTFLQDRKLDQHCFQVTVEQIGFLGSDASDAVPHLAAIVDNREEEQKLRYSAIVSLGKIGPPAQSAIPSVVKALHDSTTSLQTRIVAAKTLGEMGNSAIPALSSSLFEGDLHIQLQVECVSALGTIGSPSLNELLRALMASETRVRATAARVLARLNEEVVIEELAQALLDEDESVRSFAASSLAPIGDRKVFVMSDLSSSEIESVLASQRVALPIAKPADRLTLQRSITALQAELDSRWWGRLLEFFRSSPWGSWTAIALLLLLAWMFLFVLWSLLLIVRPSVILSVNNFFKPWSDLKLKKTFEKTISLRHLLVVGFFYTHGRVLDAWVSKYTDTARVNFQAIPTVEATAAYVAVAVNFDNQLVPDFAVEVLKPEFLDSKRLCILIQGQGGIGKTSLACQIAKWGMDREVSKRLAPHTMLPILIEDEVSSEGLVEKARGELQALIGEPNPIDPDWFTHLLRQQRVMVIVDRFSELCEESRQRVTPRSPGFPISALVVTSRIEEPQLGGVCKLQPSLLKRNRVSSFIDAYLGQRNKSHLFEDDEEYFDDCRRLSRMVGDRQITALLAKLYIDQLVRLKEAGKDSIPESIPELMLQYVRELHQPASDPDKIVIVLADAQSVAWQCLKENFHPVAVNRDSVLTGLKGENIDARLEYLEDTLHILKRDLARTRFLLEPLAEYLAGLHVVEMYKGNKKLWKLFLKRAEEMPVEKVTGFLLAVRDCCLAAVQIRIPSFVCEELEKLTELDRNLIERQQQQQRVARLKSQLALPDAEDRMHAIQALGHIGLSAKKATPDVLRSLEDKNKDIRAAAASALGQFQAVGAVSALREVLTDEDAFVRASAAEALGKIGSSAADVVPVLATMLLDDDSSTSFHAARALEKLNPDVLLNELIQVLRRATVSFHRYRALLLLESLEIHSEAALHDVINALGDGDWRVRFAASEVLASYKEKAALAVSALTRALNDPSAVVRNSATTALGAIGEQAKDTIPELMNLLDGDDEIEVRIAAGNAIKEIEKK